MARRRYNLTEQATLDIIISEVSPKRIYRKHNSLKIVKFSKEINNEFKLFFDAESSLKTFKDNNKRTEFVLHGPKYGIDWRIECKFQITDSNLIDGILQQVVEITKAMAEEKLILIVGGFLATSEVMNKIQKKIDMEGLSNKFWMGTLDNFCEILKNIIS